MLSYDWHKHYNSNMLGDDNLNQNSNILIHDYD